MAYTCIRERPFFPALARSPAEFVEFNQCQSGKQKSPEKTLENKNKNQQQIQGIGNRGIEHELHLWEASDLISALALLPFIDFNGKSEIQLYSIVQFVLTRMYFFCTEQNKNIESLLLEMNKQLSEVKDVLKKNKTKSKSK